MRKRLLAMVMAIFMVAGMLPVSAFAVDCDHHPEHTTECGYVEAVAGVPCTHECGADCYSTVDNCTHGDNHDADCGWAAATGETPEAPCGHTCGDTCKTQVLNCTHGDDHDEACGYVAAVEGIACKFVCNTCSGTNPASEGGEDDDPVCTGDETCTLTEGHNEGCPKAEPVCTKDESCVYTGIHQDGCPKAETTGETNVCTVAEGCEATQHKDTCPKYVWLCDKTDDCKAATHEDTCPKYVWPCDKTDDCKAATHEDLCPKYVWPCDKTDDCKAATHEDLCPKYVWPCDKTDDCKATTHDEGCPHYVAPCTHTYSPWDWYEDTANPDNNTFVRSCTLCQADERNYMPEEVLQIMTATSEDALATKAALEQAVIDDTLTQAAADMLIATLGISVLDETNSDASITVDGTTTYYATLQEAIDDASSGATVTLLRDVSYTDGVTIAKNLTLDLGQFYIRSTPTSCPFTDNSFGYSYYPAALYVRNSELGTINVVITASSGGIISGNVAIMSGNISNDGDNKFTNLTINGGNYSGSRYCIFHNNGLLTINSGTYQDTYTGTEPQHLLYSYRYNYFFGDFTINGGRFKGFNPACAYMHGGEYSTTTGSAKHWHGYVPEGKTGVLGDDGWYTVADGSRVVQRTSTIATNSSSFICHCYASLQDAVDAGETNVTLLANISENFTIKNDFTLNLGSYTLNGAISVADGAIKVKDDGGIDGVSVTINGNTGNTSEIKLTEPYLDHYIFSGWCHGTNNQTTYTDAEKTAKLWNVEIGNTYHSTHWVKSGYEHLPSEDLHHTFEMTYSEGTPNPQTVTFRLDVDGVNTAQVTGVTQAEYFNVSFVEGTPTITMTPNVEKIKELTAGTYDDLIHVTVSDGSTHGVAIKLIIAKADTNVTTPEHSSEYTYGDKITFTADVEKSSKVRMSSGEVQFYCGQVLLGTAEVVYEEGSYPQKGTATLIYDTTLGDLAIGKNDITAVFPGTVNLNGSRSSEVELTLKAKVIEAGETETFNGVTITGPATVDLGGIHVEEGGAVKIGDTTITSTGDSFTVGNDGSIQISGDTTVDIDGVTVTGPATVDKDGNATVNVNGKVTIDGEDYTVTSGTATVTDGKFTVTDDSTISVGENTVTGPASVDRSGDVTIEAGGKVNDVTVPTGTTITVPEDKLGDVTETGGVITVPAGSTITTDDATVEVTEGSVTVDSTGKIEVDDDATVNVDGTVITGPATVDENGSVSVGEGGTVTNGDTTVEVENGSITVDKDGNVTIPEDTTISTGDTTITGPATVNPDGDLTVNVGGTITNGDTTVEVENGTVTVDKDGNVTIPEDAIVSAGDTTITGPAAVDPEGEITVNTGGSITNGDTEVEVENGSVVVDKDGNITVPDNSSVSTGDTTITGPAEVDSDGDITIDKGGSITNGETEVEVEDGSITVDKDGNVTIPEDTTITTGDTTITGPATVDPDGDITVDKGGSITSGDTTVDIEDGSVTVDKDGNVTIPEDTTISTGDTTITGPAEVNPNGDITVNEGGTITNGDTKVEIEDGSVTVDKDGNVTIPEDTTISAGNTTVTGPATVDPEGEITVDKGGTITNGDTIVEVGDGSVTVDKDGNVTVPAGSGATVNGEVITDSAVIGKDGLEVFYKVTVGASLTVTKGHSATFVSNAPFEKFVGVLVDGKSVSASNYTAVSGSTKVTLSAAYINTLSAGEHTLTIVSKDGSASTTFTVKSKTTTNSDIPTTGDNEMPVLWITLFSVSAFGAVAALMPKRKKGKYLR